MTLKQILIAGLAAAGIATATMPAQAAVLWYNGDFDGWNGLASAQNAVWPDARTYDDFTLASAAVVTGVFGNFLMNFTAATAHWEIRSGVSANNGGTLIASGTDPLLQTPNLLNAFGYTGYRLEITGLNVALGPGTYWLTIAPIGAGSGEAYVDTTSGANAVGTPAGNDGNSFWDFPLTSQNFVPAGPIVAAQIPDFSLGVNGQEVSAVPEPTSLVLLGAGLLGLRVARRRG